MKNSMIAIVVALVLLTPVAGAGDRFEDPEIGRTFDGDLAVRLAGASSLQFSSFDGESASIGVDEFGTRTVDVIDIDGEALLSLSVSGMGEAVSFQIDALGDGSYGIIIDGDDSISLAVEDAQAGTIGSVALDDGILSIQLDDPQLHVPGVGLSVANVPHGAAFTITYLDDPVSDSAESDATRIVPGVAGLTDGESLGGPIELAVTGLKENSVILLSFSYDGADKNDITEADLRLTQSDGNSYSAAGESDQGISEPSFELGAYGVDVDQNLAWAAVSSLGTFAIGIPISTLAASIEPTEQAPICGAINTTTLLPIAGALGAWRFAPRRRRARS